MSSCQLVSVCVVAYRSAPFIEQTLDSILQQSYRRLELIVSDDCSPDDTAERCEAWLQAHEGRFERTQLIRSMQNTGVSANANRAFRAAQGEWIKIIAADDLLLPTCIEQNMAYAEAHSEVEIIFSNLKEFGEGIEPEGRIADYTRYFTRLSPREFRLWQMVYSALPAPSSFMRKTTFERLGGFDESIPFMEDKPFWLKAIDQKVPIACFAGPTVAYRIHGSSLVQSKKQRSKTDPRLRQSEQQAARLFLGYMRRENFWLWLYGKSLYAKEQQSGIVPYLLYFLRLLNPYYYYFKRLKRRL